MYLNSIQSEQEPSLASAVWDLIQSFDEDFSTLREDDESIVRSVFGKIEIHVALKKMVTGIYDKRSESFRENYEREKHFACSREESTQTIRLYCKESEINTDDFYFYLGELILDALFAELPDVALFKTNDERKRRFLFELIKLLRFESFSDLDPIGKLNDQSFQIFNL